MTEAEKKIEISAEDRELSEGLLDFIQKSPSMFHTVQTIRETLDAAGFVELAEEEAWQVERGGRYYTRRNGSSILAFAVGSEADQPSFQLTASHSDSPTFKLKAKPELAGPAGYLQLNVEGYGGMIDSTWLDRPLGLAGRCLVREGDRIESRLLAMDRDLLLIPNVPIHFNHEVNKGYAFNHQVDLLPLFSAGALQQGDFQKMLAEALAVEVDQVLSWDLYLVNREPGRIWGYGQEFVSSPKLDDLQCAYAALQGFLAGDNPKGINVYVCFDNEEVGSNTKQGALSTFLADSLRRLAMALGWSQEDYYRAQARSFLVSCDNAHAVHPNHPEIYDPENRTYMNRGLVIKENADQHYTSDAFSEAAFLAICERAGVPVQRFANRSDMGGGSTLGNLSNLHFSTHAVDIGLPQLAMHSSYETAGVKDTAYAVKALTAFYDHQLEIHGAEGLNL